MSALMTSACRDLIEMCLANTPLSVVFFFRVLAMFLPEAILSLGGICSETPFQRQHVAGLRDMRDPAHAKHARARHSRLLALARVPLRTPDTRNCSCDCPLSHTLSFVVLLPAVGVRLVCCRDFGSTTHPPGLPLGGL